MGASGEMADLHTYRSQRLQFRVCVFTLPGCGGVCRAQHHQELGSALGSKGNLGAHQAAEQMLGPQRSSRWGLMTVEGEEAEGHGRDAWFWLQEPSGCDSQVGPLVGGRLGAKGSQHWAKPSLRHWRGVCAIVHVHTEGSECWGQSPGDTHV